MSPCLTNDQFEHLLTYLYRSTSEGQGTIHVRPKKVVLEIIRVRVNITTCFVRNKFILLLAHQLLFFAWLTLTSLHSLICPEKKIAFLIEKFVVLSLTIPYLNVSSHLGRGQSNIGGR